MLQTKLMFKARSAAALRGDRYLKDTSSLSLKVSYTSSVKTHKLVA